MNMDNYPHVTITEDGSSCSTGQYHPRFPRVLYDTVFHLSYNRDVLVYRGRMFTAHGQERCKVSMMIPLSLTEPWGAIIIGVELDETIEQAAHIALITLCESCLNDKAMMPIALFPICKKEDPMWKRRLQAVMDPEGRHFHTGMATMIEYAQYMFNLQ
jgi:hypothetical protein